MKLTHSLKFTLKAVCIVLAAAAVVILSSLFPSGISKYDMTGNRMYTLTNESKRVLKGLDKDVTIYLLSEEGEENESLSIFLERYKKASGHVKISHLDLTEDQPIVQSLTTDTLTSNSIIVSYEGETVSQTRTAVIPCGELFHYSAESYLTAFNVYATYYTSSFSFTDFMTLYAPYFPYATLYTGFDFENQVTSAINYVTGNVKKVYMPVGHGEASLGKSFINRLCTEGIEILKFDLSVGEIGDDADAVLLMPTTDISETEKTKLSSYIESGGKVMLLTTYGAQTPVLNSLIKAYGVENTGKYLCEDNENYCMISPGLIMPDISSEEEELLSKLEELSANVLLGGTTGALIAESTPENVTVSPILTTSPEAYAKGEATDFSFSEENDVRGQYYGGLDIASGNGRIVWFTSGALVNEEYNVYSTRGNEEVFVFYLNSLASNTEKTDIPPTLSTDDIVDVSINTVYIYFATFTIVSIIILVYGIVRKYKRVNK